MPLLEKELSALRNRLDELSIAWDEDTLRASDAAQEVQGIKEWLKENRKIVDLTELIPAAKMAEGELAYITKGQYEKHWGREPKDVILTKDGKRVRWEYAMDELAGELRLEDGDAVRDMIILASEYKERKASLEHALAVAEDDIEVAKGKLEKVTIHIGKRELVTDIQDDRTPQAKGSDDAKQAKSVLSFPNVEPWMSDPGRHDIRGVDMARLNAIRKANNARKARRASPRISTMRR